MKIYTKTGDKGETSLFGGKRVWKDDFRISAYGSVDELNTILGVSNCEIKNKELNAIIAGIQNDLFTVGSDLAAPFEKENKGIVIPRIKEINTIRLESLIDFYSEKLPELKNFVLPGGSKGASLLQNARSVCRRAERMVIALSRNEVINEKVIIYLNRLSDLLFVLSRYENHLNGMPEPIWQK